MRQHRSPAADLLEAIPKWRSPLLGYAWLCFRLLTLTGQDKVPILASFFFYDACNFRSCDCFALKLQKPDHRVYTGAISVT